MMSMMTHPAAHTMRARPVEVKSSACRTAITIATSIQTDTASRIRAPSPGTMPNTRSTPGAAREARGPEQLSDVDLGLGLGKDLRPKDVNQRCPGHPSDQRCAGPDEQARTFAGQPDAAGHAGERDHEHGLTGRGLVRLHLLVDGRPEAGGADEAVGEGTHVCGVYTMLRRSHPRAEFLPVTEVPKARQGPGRPGRSLCHHTRRSRRNTCSLPSRRTSGGLGGAEGGAVYPRVIRCYCPVTWPPCAWPMTSRLARARGRPRGAAPSLRVP